MGASGKAINHAGRSGQHGPQAPSYAAFVAFRRPGASSHSRSRSQLNCCIGYAAALYASQTTEEDAVNCTSNLVCCSPDLHSTGDFALRHAVQVRDLAPVSHTSDGTSCAPTILSVLVCLSLQGLRSFENVHVRLFPALTLQTSGGGSPTHVNVQHQFRPAVTGLTPSRGKRVIRPCLLLLTACTSTAFE